MSVEAVSLGEIATIIAGQSPPGSTYNESGLGLPFFQGKADFGKTHPVARKWCVAPKKIAEVGDILISVRAPVGPTNIAGERCCIGRGLAAIRPDETIALRDFVHWVIKHRESELVAKGQGSTFVAIGQKDLNSLTIPLPPLDEQRRIATILSRAARIERLRARIADRLREFIPALFIKMFGDPIENPIGWPVARLGDACTIIGGGTPRRSNGTYFGGAILWATPTDVTTLNDIFISHTAETITETGLKRSSARLVPEGTVLMTSRATIGYTAIAVKPMATNQGFANLICGERLMPEYLSFWLSGQRNRLIQLSGGTTFKEISKSTLKGVLIPLPPLALQSRYARLLQSVRCVAATAETASRAASDLAASLTDWLLDDGS